MKSIGAERGLRLKSVSWNLQAVHEVLITYDNGQGWAASIEYYVDGMKISKSFYNPRTETLQEKVAEIEKFIQSV